jgi:hypothetical protein
MPDIPIVSASDTAHSADRPKKPSSTHRHGNRRASTGAARTAAPPTTTGNTTRASSVHSSHPTTGGEARRITRPLSRMALPQSRATRRRTAHARSASALRVARRSHVRPRRGRVEAVVEAAATASRRYPAPSGAQATFS